MNYNELYRCGSTLRLAPLHIFPNLPEGNGDRNFEIVYCAIETFDDGHVHDVIVYRKTNPEYDPRNKRNPAFAHIAETITVRQSVSWAEARAKPIA